MRGWRNIALLMIANKVPGGRSNLPTAQPYFRYSAHPKALLNILQIFEQFPTQESCIQYLEKIRWGNEIRCPYCNSTNTAKAEHRHRCYTCKTSFSVTVGTIFHHTHLPLQKWFLAIMLMLNAKKGISALQLSRDLRVNKNTAWRMNMQIRKAMTQIEQRPILQGIVEMDETYIGGKPRNGTRGDGKDGKHKPVKAQRKLL